MSVQEIPRELIQKYSASAVPRYTSYPTAVEFTQSFGPSDWRKLLAEEATADRALSLYFHVPFCRQLCYFCACNKVITNDRSLSGTYLDALEREMELYLQVLGKRRNPVAQIHWGGGSPNFLLPEEMSRLHRRTLAAFPELSKDAEVSVELDPRTTSVEQLEALRSSGFTRVSFGVQDFDPEVQETVNRIQTFEQTLELVNHSRRLGFSGLNLDLIYGLPLQTVEGFAKTLDSVMQIRPDRIALYGYAHVTWLQKVQNSFRKFHLPTPEERIALFQLAVGRLLAAGYLHIGLDHFALPEDSLARALNDGTLNRNFMGYTTHKGASLLGFGASSISTLPAGFAQNEKDPAVYQQRVAHGDFATVRGYSCSVDDQLRAEVIQQILCTGVVRFSEIASRWEVDPIERFAESFGMLEESMRDGLVELDESSLRVTSLGRYFARSIASTFDAFLARHRQSSRPVFSQAV